MSLNVEVIRDSFELAKPIASEVADKFYEFLWNDFPASKALFEEVKMEGQKKALINSLVFIVENVDNGDKLVPYLEKMGERHVGYGAEEEHYQWVGQSLLKTFAFFFKDKWTNELQQEWTKAYQFIATTMLKGSENIVPDMNQFHLKAKQICNNVLMETLNEGLDEEFEKFVRAKVRKVLFKVLDEETKDLFKKAS